MHATSIEIDGTLQPFQLDFDKGEWHSDEEIDEAEFPLIAEVDGKRYELYSDGTFNEEEKS